MGADNPLLAECFEEYGTSLRLQGKTESSFESVKRAFRIADLDFRKRSSILAEKDAIVLSRKLHKYADNLYSLFLVKNTPTADDTFATADVALAMKGRNADVGIEYSRWLSTERDPVIASLADEYRSTQLLLSRRFINSAAGNANEQRSLIDSLKARCEALEDELARLSRHFKEANTNRGITSHQIATLIAPNTTLIEYLKWTFANLKSATVTPALHGVDSRQHESKENNGPW